MGSSCPRLGRMTKCCKDEARCQEQLEKNLTGSGCFSLIVSPYSQNYLPDTHLWILVCNKNHRQNGLVKAYFFPRLFSLNWTWGGQGRIHRDPLYHHAWGTPSLVRHHLSVSPNSIRATGTEGWWYPFKKEVLVHRCPFLRRIVLAPQEKDSWGFWAMCQQTPEKSVDIELASFWGAISMLSGSVGLSRSHTEGHWQQSEWTREVFKIRRCNIVVGEVPTLLHCEWNLKMGLVLIWVWKN